MLRNNYYLHFATDLRRAVFCLTNNNEDGARTFLLHAKHIYDTQFSDEERQHIITEEFEKKWLSLYKREFPTNAESKEKFTEEILTLSSIVFYRITARLQAMDGPLSADAATLTTPPVPAKETPAPLTAKMKI